MIKLRYCCLLLSMALGGCMSSTPGSRVWFYTYGTGSGLDSLSPVSFLELRPDKTYSRDFNGFSYGQWRRQDQQLFLTDQQHRTYIYKIEELQADEMRLLIARDRIGHFEAKSMPSSDPGEDPFSAVNNQWRLPATHKETIAEIKKRLLNHCRFWEKYFTWALNDKLDIVDVRSTPTSIKIYGNGFGLKPFEDLPARWKALFFDEDDCRKANALLEDIFRRQTIAWGSTSSKYKMFLGAFQQLENYLR